MVDHSKRVAFASHSPNIPTGFGRVTREVCTELAKHFQMFCVGWQFQGTPVYYKFPEQANDPSIPPLLICPTAQGGNYNEFGQRTFPNFLPFAKPDILMTLADWFVFHSPAHGFGDCWLPNFLRNRGNQFGFKRPRWVWYFPIDSTPICDGFVKLLQMCEYPVAMSKYGLEECTRNGVLVDYIPHGLRPKVFKRFDYEARMKIRESVGKTFGLDKRGINLRDRYCFFWGGRNQIRKFPQLLIEVYGRFLERLPDARKNTFLFMHSTHVPYEVGFNLPWHIKRWRLEDNVAFTNASQVYVPNDKILNEIMNMGDCYLDTAGGEGFGFFRIESAGVEMARIMPAFTTSPELMDEKPFMRVDDAYSDRRKDGKIGLVKTKHGFLVPLMDHWTHGLASDFGIIDREYFVDAMVWVYEHQKEAKQMGIRGRDFVYKEYNWQAILPQWKTLIDRVYADDIDLELSEKKDVPEPSEDEQPAVQESSS